MKVFFVLIWITAAGSEPIAHYDSLALCQAVASLAVRNEPGAKALCLPVPIPEDLPRDKES